MIIAAASEPIARFMGEPEVAGMVVAGGLTFAIYSVGSTSQAVFMREMRFRSIELRNWLALLTGASSRSSRRPAGPGRGRWSCSRSCS